MRYSFLLAALLFASTVSVRGQSVAIREIDTSDPAVVRARFYAFDASGAMRTDLSKGDLRVVEDGVAREVIELRCPDAGDPRALSAVLCLDISGSMRHGAPRISVARTAAVAWVRGMREGGEAAIVSFDDRGYVNQDLTDDSVALLGAIGRLEPAGGTNYNGALLGEPAGALAIAREGANRRIIVFLTDGRGTADEEKIIAIARRDSITIYCVTVGLPAPDVLKRIASRTGGEFFENVSTAADAENIYRMILHRAQGEEPCEVVWKGEPACSSTRVASVAVDRGGVDTITYRTATSSLARVDMDISTLRFGGVSPGTTQEVRVTLTTRAHPITIERFVPTGNTTRFTLDAPATPFMIPANGRLELKVRYAPADSGLSFARLGIVTDKCPGGSIVASGGYGGKPPLEPTIRLLYPNGGERFPTGEMIDIEWDGVLPTDTVRLEYSIDSGASWRTIAPSATGLKHRWTVPNTPSERCLARVEQIRGGSGTVTTPDLLLAGHNSFVTGAFSHDGSRIATASHDGTAKIWDAGSGRLLKTLTLSRPTANPRPPRAYHTEFSPDGTRLLTAIDGGRVQIWDVATGQLDGRVDGWLPNRMAVAFVPLDGTFGPSPVFSPDGARLLTVCILPATGGTSWNCNGVSIWDARNGRLIRRVGDHSGYIYSAEFSPDGRRIVTASQDSTARVWNVATGAEELVLRGHAGRVRYATFTPDGRSIVSAGYDGKVRVWDAATGAEILTIAPERGRFISTMSVSPDGSLVLVGAGAGGGSLDLKTYDLATGLQIAEMSNQGSNGSASFLGDGSRVASWSGLGVDILDARSGTVLRSVEIDGREDNQMVLSPDGGRVAAGTSYRLGVWDVTSIPLQVDRSDSLWAIIATELTAVDIDFGGQLVGTVRDSVIAGAILNSGTVPVRIDEIAILGAGRGDFGIISGAPPVTLEPGQSHAVEFRFDPGRTGKRTAKIEIRAAGTRLEQTISGEGVVPRLVIDPALIDFGTIPVGESRDTIVTTLLKNEGTEPVEIRGVVQLGPDTTQFAVVDGGESFLLAPGASHAMELRFSAGQEGASSARIGFLHGGVGSPAVAHMFGRGERGEGFVDPTTFRTIAVPNAIIPRAGTLVGGLYDIVGLMAGYAVTDNIMILAGGAVPLPDDWGGIRGKMYGAYSIGVKAGIEVIDGLNIAAGYQWGRSIFDDEITPEGLESRITAGTGYGAVSYGDDHSRLSVTFGHASKQHVRLTGIFDTTAAIVAIGGDYEFASRWKICAEAVTMQSLGYIPIALSARWFGRDWALDVGAAYVGLTTEGGEAPEFPVVPVVSYVMVF